MENTGLQTSEGKLTIATIATTLGSILGAIALLPAEQLAVFERFLPVVIWPLCMVAAAYILGRSIVKYAQLRDVPPPIVANPPQNLVP